MRRRDVIALAGASVAWPFAAMAQEPGPNGYELRPEQFADHASEIVKQGVDLIVCVGDDAIRAAQQATKIIPILAGSEDMVGSGFVHSMAKPEGNITGHSIMSFEMNGKRQEILMELLPAARHMAALTDTYTYSPERLQSLQKLTRQRGVELSVYRVSKPEELTGAIEAAKNSGALALNVLASVFVYVHRRIIYERVSALSLPAMYQFPLMAKEGGLIGYGVNILQVWRDIVPRQAAKLLRGVKVAEVPVEQPTKVELAINLKTAKALGLGIPESFLSRADEVIE
jgi:putative ABC transport system substrate-binding protein